MKAQLAGIASHTGMAGRFPAAGLGRLRVLSVEPCRAVPLPAPRAAGSAAHRGRSLQRTRLADLRLLDDALDACCDCRISASRHAMVLIVDSARAAALHGGQPRLCRPSGVGSEIAYRPGRDRRGGARAHADPHRPHDAASTPTAGRCANSVAADVATARLETEIPLPGLAEPHSQFAVPVRRRRRAGRRAVRREREGLRILASTTRTRWWRWPRQLGCDHRTDAGARRSRRGTRRGAGGRAAATARRADEVRHYAPDDSVFIGDDYLIKGVAGAILWKLLRERARTAAPSSPTASCASTRDPPARHRRQPRGAAGPARRRLPSAARAPHREDRAWAVPARG